MDRYGEAVFGGKLQLAPEGGKLLSKYICMQFYLR